MSGEPDAIFDLSSNGLKTNRDAWVYNSSRSALVDNVNRMIDFYNDQVDAFHASHPSNGTVKQRAAAAKQFVDMSPSTYSWNQSDYDRVATGTRYHLDNEMLRVGLYRPFFKRQVAVHGTLNERTYQLPLMWPTSSSDNLAIGVVSPGSKSPFGTLATDQTPSLHLINSDTTIYFSRWRYQQHPDQDSLLTDVQPVGPVSNVSPTALRRFREAFGDEVGDDDVFFYVYGVLHAPDFRREFEVNLKKEAPRVPLVADRSTFDSFALAGRELCSLHVGYDHVDPYPLKEEWVDEVGPGHADFVQTRLLVGDKRMRYPKITSADGTKVADKSRLVYNPYLTLAGIPERAHDYILGTRSGIDWIIDRYYVKTDSASGIVDDVNQWALEHDDPRYILDLIKRVVTISVRTLDIVNQLPELHFEAATDEET